MSSLRTHFEERAARLSDCATVQSREESGATVLRLTPHQANAVGVVLYLGPGDYGTVQLDDQAAVPAELGDDVELDVKAIDHIIDTAVEGRATAFHIGRGGWRRGVERRHCVSVLEERLALAGVETTSRPTRLPPVPLRERTDLPRCLHP